MELSQRAQQVWQVLANAAHCRQVLTPAEVTSLIGADLQTLTAALDTLARYCDGNCMPPLVLLIAPQATGVPATMTFRELSRKRDEVFRCEWLKLQVPSVAELDAARAGPETTSERRSVLAGLRTVDGRRLNEAWGVGATHALYHKNGTWYHQLVRFPGALFDADGYVRFETEEAFRKCPGVTVEQEVHVRGGVSSLPGYVRVR